MNIEFDTSKLDDQLVSVLIAPGHQVSEPDTRVNSVSFPCIPLVRRAITTGVIAFGTITVGQPADSPQVHDLRIHIVFPTVETHSTNLLTHYKRLREEVVAAGIPLLDDEELRAEIRGRKGLRAEPEE